ncbi:hypothetical protein BDW67DRAFT_150339 [Aspergillus spinulosporus]
MYNFHPSSRRTQQSLFAASTASNRDPLVDLLRPFSRLLYLFFLALGLGHLALPADCSSFPLQKH